ncbi:MAG: hypothetical protein U5K71_12065 [Gracilimonas sp.]|nr:hypothetical protein [Gracilimonas sp.]
MCTKDRLALFGADPEWDDGINRERGCAAWYFWDQIPDHFDNVKLDAFVVMPDHMHGIIQIIPDENGRYSPDPVGTLHATSLQGDMDGRMSVVCQSRDHISNYSVDMKVRLPDGATKKITNLDRQPGSYDHIIRNYPESLNILSGATLV